MSYTTGVYREQGGDRLVIAAGGTLHFAGGTLSGLVKGDAYYVDSVAGSNDNDGTSWETAKATLDAAVGLCTASQGDTIYIAPGHAETLAADVDVDVAGISIIGIGNGENRPVFTIGADGVKFDIDAANCRLSNVVIKIDADDVTAAVDVDGAGFTIEDCEVLEGAGADEQALIGVAIGADRCTVRRCYFKSVVAGANSAIKIETAVDRTTIVGCEVFGDYADACIHNPTSAVATRVLIKDNVLTNLQSGDHAIELVSACTGTISRNIVNSTLAAVGTRGAIDPGACFCVENYGSDGVGDVSGVLNPAADA